MCSSLPLLCWFMESVSQLFSSAAAASSQPLIGVSGDENMLNTLEDDDVSTAANVAAQKHFKQSRHMFQL